jgi:alpha-tubulin suppressor-like RCC1 family protein
MHDVSDSYVLTILIEYSMNLLLIDSSIKKYNLFVDSVNSNTLPIVYFPHTTREELLQEIKKVDRIAIASYSKTMIDGESLFSDANIDFIKTIIDTKEVKHIDFLACNTLDDPLWIEYFDKLPKSVIIGASDNKTGNLKYGGDWIMENICENIETIYFNESIKYYTYLLDSLAYFTPVLSYHSLYLQGDFNNYFNQELATLKEVVGSITKISCGHYHTVVLTLTGRVFACGNNQSGQLGNGTFDNKNIFTEMTPVGATFTQIACGFNHTVALSSTGRVFACGDNQFGQLGNNSFVNKTILTEMTSVGQTFTQIACGFNHTVALTSTGRVFACGYNQFGQLGNNSFVNKSILTIMNNPFLGATFTQISCGYDHTVALTSTGRVFACGRNNYGQLGTSNFTNMIVLSPMLVPYPGIIFTKIASICSFHTGAITSTGDLFTCGRNNLGQLGDGTINNNKTILTAMALPSGLTFSQIACGLFYTVVITSDGFLGSCGDNQYGQLGNGSSDNKIILTPMTIPSGAIFTQISCGYYHTLVLDSIQNGYSCGYNNVGQLGNGYFGNIKPFTLIGNNINSFTLNETSIYVIKTDGLLYAYGNNPFGQLGNGSTDNKTTFTAMTIPSGVIFSQIACGLFHTVALTSTGRIFACGRNNLGQLGDSTTANKNILTEMVSVGQTFTQIACGTDFTVALTSTGRVFACGRNNLGQLGNNSLVNKTILTEMTSVGQTFTQIACGLFHTVALTSTGRVFACGDNQFGQLGNNSLVNKTILTEMTYVGQTFTQIACGYDHTVALTSTGRVFACGYNQFGQLGDNTNVNKSILTEMAFVGQTFTQIACGYDNTIAYTLNGDVYACGDNFGQIDSTLQPYSILTKIDTSIIPKPTPTPTPLIPETITLNATSARCIGTFRSGTTTLASNTVSRDQSFSAKRAMVVQKVEQNRIPKVGVMDSSQRTSLRVASLGNLRTQFATRNGNDVKSALLRTRNAGSVAPKKKNAAKGSANSTISYGGHAGSRVY